VGRTREEIIAFWEREGRLPSDLRPEERRLYHQMLRVGKSRTFTDGMSRGLRQRVRAKVYSTSNVAAREGSIEAWANQIFSKDPRMPFPTKSDPHLGNFRRQLDEAIDEGIINWDALIPVAHERIEWYYNRKHLDSVPFENFLNDFVEAYGYLPGQSHTAASDALKPPAYYEELLQSRLDRGLDSNVFTPKDFNPRTEKLVEKYLDSFVVFQQRLEELKSKRVEQLQYFIKERKRMPNDLGMKQEMELYTWLDRKLKRDGWHKARLWVHEKFRDRKEGLFSHPRHGLQW